MSLLEALENRDQHYDSDIGTQLQRWVSLTTAAIVGASSMFGMGTWGIIAGIWFLLATAWPAPVGRATAMLTIVFSAIIITMGDTTGGSLIQPVLALGTIPMIFIAALLSSERFAATIAVTGVYLYRKLFGRFTVRD